MNLNVAVPPPRKPNRERILKIELAEKNDIIKQLQKELKLVKQSLLETSLKASQLCQDLELLQDRLITAESESENWKKEAFSSVSDKNALISNDVKSSPEYKKIKKSLKCQSLLHQRELEALTQQHKAEINKIIHSVPQHSLELSELAASQLQADREKDSEIETLREQLLNAQKEVASLHADNDNMKLQLNSWSITHADDINNINTLVNQLRTADEHVLEQSEAFQELQTRLNKELLRKENCKYCKKFK
jgi:hypothetical protein